MTRRRWLVVGVAGLALVGLLALASPTGVRLGLSLAGCLLLPGLGWARKLRLGDLGDTVATAVVLSMCCTVAVGTAMALSGAWSLGWGLAALALVAAAGFVPAGALADRAHARVQARVARFSDDGGAWADWYAWYEQQQRRQSAAAVEQASDVWVDWYTDSARRGQEEQTRRAAAVRQATADWVAWQQRSQQAESSPQPKDDRG